MYIRAVSYNQDDDLGLLTPSQLRMSRPVARASLETEFGTVFQTICDDLYRPREASTRSWLMRNGCQIRTRREPYRTGWETSTSHHIDRTWFSVADLSCSERTCGCGH